jgi:prepilin-type N-terminal cleavage/methylation domain-containing protein
MTVQAHSNVSARSGFSLLEVIVAMAVFLISIVGIGKLVSIGVDHGINAEIQSEAAHLCQSKMSEVVFGAVSLQSQSDTPLDEDPSWTWSMTADQQSTANGLWKVSITFSRKRAEGDSISCTVEQYVLDPSIRGSTMDTPSTTSSSSTSTGGN